METRKKLSVSVTAYWRNRPRVMSARRNALISRALKGRPKTETHRQKIAETLRGRKQPPEIAQKRIEGMKCFWANEDNRLALSLKRRGAQSHMWRGGLTAKNLQIRQSYEYCAWRRAVFARDNYTCVICKLPKSGRLQADHIKPFAFFPELRFELSNGRTLCIECHKQTDTYLNKIRNAKREDFL